jgi:gamma-glutamyl hydrolase
MHGLSVKKYNNSPKINQKLKIISISKDKDGKWFCSALEGRDKPIFLTQYHPEKQGFQWSKKGDILHNKYSIEISQYLAQKFVN